MFTMDKNVTLLIFDYHYSIISAIVIFGWYMISNKKIIDFELTLFIFLVENILFQHILKLLFFKLLGSELVISAYVINLVCQVLLVTILEKNIYIFFSKIFSTKKRKIVTLFLLIFILFTEIMWITPKQSSEQNFITNNHDSSVSIMKIDQNDITKSNQMFLIFLCIFLISVIYTVRKVKKRKQIQKMLYDKKMMEKYIDTLESLQLDIMKIQHDYKNILLGINGFLNDEENIDVPNLKNFLQKNNLIQNNTQMKTGTLNQLKKINMFEIKGLVSIKMIQAAQKEINISIECSEDVSIERIDIVDLSRILGIILDNAIEECEKQIGGELRIAFIDDGKKIVIIVMNTCERQSLDISEYSQFGHSTKGENRGIGLGNVHEIIRKYRNVSLETTCENYEFRQKLFIEK